MKPTRALVAATLLFLITLPIASTAQTKQSAFDGPGVRQTRRRGPHRKRSRKVAADAAPTGATKTTSGLVYVITRPGSGRLPNAGDTVVVNYTGVLSNGLKFDSSLDRGQPFEFKLGAGRVIKGWDEGIAKLHVGEQATLIIPPQLGYGERGAGAVIPPNATLIFVVELLGIKEADAQSPK